MVVSLSTGHASDWEWQAVTAQMEDLRRQNYIMKLKQDPWGSTYWTITTSGMNYLHALERFESPVAAEGEAIRPQLATEVTISAEPPVPTPKKHVAPWVERFSLRVSHFIHWEEMPTHLTAHLAYDVIKYLVFGGAVAILGVSGWVAYRLIHRLVHWIDTMRWT